MPPTLVTSGCTMSSARASSHGWNACRRVSTSPPEMGTRRVLAQLREVLEGIGDERLLEPMHIVVGEHVRRVERPFVAVRPEGIAGAGIDHQTRLRRPPPRVPP